MGTAQLFYKDIQDLIRVEIPMSIGFCLFHHHFEIEYVPFEEAIILSDMINMVNIKFQITGFLAHQIGISIIFTHVRSHISAPGSGKD